MINLVSYFEIGGKIFECATYQGDANQPEFFQPMDELGVMVAEKVVETAVTKALGKESYDVKRAMRAPRRYTSARSALAVAGTLAAADGPLPIGDVLAIGVLTGFALYQGYHGIQDLRQ